MPSVGRPRRAPAASARCATSGSSIGSSRRGSKLHSARRRCGCSRNIAAKVCPSGRRRRRRGCFRGRGTRTSSIGWPRLAKRARSPPSTADRPSRRAAPPRRCSPRAARTSCRAKRVARWRFRPRSTSTLRRRCRSSRRGPTRTRSKECRPRYRAMSIRRWCRRPPSMQRTSCSARWRRSSVTQVLRPWPATTNPRSRG